MRRYAATEPPVGDEVMETVSEQDETSDIMELNLDALEEMLEQSLEEVEELDEEEELDEVERNWKKKNLK